MLLKDIAPAAANNITTKFIVLEKGKKTTTETCLTLVADETAAVHFQLWGDECDAFEPGDILLLTDGIFSYNNNRRDNAVLRAGKRGQIRKVGEFTLAYVETPNMSEIVWGVDPHNNNKFIKNTTLSPYSRVFPPAHS